MGEHGSIACGDSMRFTFRVKRHPSDPAQDVITEAKYLTFGCTSAIASSEALCEIIEKGSYTPLAALQIQNKDIVDYLNGLPEQKIHCSVMGAEALEAAVFNWAQRRGVDLKKLGVDMHDEDTDEGRMVCKCFSLTEPYIKRKIRELNLKTIPQITNAIKAGGGCTSCHHVPGGLQDLLDQVWGGQAAATSAGAIQLPVLQAEPVSPEFSPYQFAKKVERVINEYIRPALRADGGDVEIMDIKGTLVYCSLRGACANCAGASQTLKIMIERNLKDQVDERIRVIEV
jgi:NifU-like protein